MAKAPTNKEYDPLSDRPRLPEEEVENVNLSSETEVIRTAKKGPSPPPENGVDQIVKPYKETKGHAAVHIPDNGGLTPLSKLSRAEMKQHHYGETREKLRAEERYIVQLDRPRKKEPKFVTVGINGIKWRIMKGEMVEVPRAIYRILVKSRHVRPQTVEDQRFLPRDQMVEDALTAANDDQLVRGTSERTFQYNMR